MNRLMEDLEIDRAKNPKGALADRWDPEEENNEDDDDGDINIVDRSEFRPLFMLHPRCRGDLLL